MGKPDAVLARSLCWIAWPRNPCPLPQPGETACAAFGEVAWREPRRLSCVEYSRQAGRRYWTLTTISFPIDMRAPASFQMP